MRHGLSILRFAVVVNALVLAGVYVCYRGAASVSGSPGASGVEPSDQVAESAALEPVAKLSVVLPIVQRAPVPVPTPRSIVMAGSKSGGLTFVESNGRHAYNQAGPTLWGGHLGDDGLQSPDLPATAVTGSALIPTVAMPPPQWGGGIDLVPRSSLFPASVSPDGLASTAPLPWGGSLGDYAAGPLDWGSTAMVRGRANFAVLEPSLKPSVTIPPIQKAPAAAPRTRMMILRGTKSGPIFSDFSPTESRAPSGK